MLFRSDNIVVVVGHQAEEVETYLQHRATYALQQPQLGTGHAVMQAQSLKDIDGQTLILYGDCPLVQSETMNKLYEVNEGKALTVLTAVLEDPAQYGRIVRDDVGNVLRIVEFKDCDENQRQIKEINTGIYCVDNNLLFKHLDDISNNNAQKEYYITDLIEIFHRNGYDIQGLPVLDVQEVMGINDRIDLVKATVWLQNRINTEWMRQGVTFIDPTSTYVDEDVVIGEDTVLYPNVYLQKGTIIGKSNTILPDRKSVV